MLGLYTAIPLALLLSGSGAALDFDPSKPETVKAAAKTLADSIISSYNSTLSSSPSPGTFNTKDDPDRYDYWVSGSAWTTLLEYAHLTGDTSYNDVVASALLAQAPQWNNASIGDLGESAWGLAALTAVEVGLNEPKDKEWIDLAMNVFNALLQRWQTEKSICNGGLLAGPGSLQQQKNPADEILLGKSAFSNANFFLLSARLALYSGDQTFVAWAEKIWSWIETQLVEKKDWTVDDAEIHFNQHYTAAECSKKDSAWFRGYRDRALLIEGLAVMHNVTSNSNDTKWTAPLTSFINATCSDNSECRPSSNSFENTTTDYIIRGCESGATGQCPFDNRAIKGPWIRALSRAAHLAPSMSEKLQKIVNASAVGAASRCRQTNGTDVGCAVLWGKNCNTADGFCKDQKLPTMATGGLGEVHSSLQAVQGVLWESDKEGFKHGGVAVEASTEKAARSGAMVIEAPMAVMSSLVLGLVGLMML